MMKRKLKTALFTSLGTLAACGTIQLHAATAWPAEGGQWNYGYSVAGAYSDYMHGQLYHGSTVYGYNSLGKWVRDYKEAYAGNWSQAFISLCYSGSSFY